MESTSAVATFTCSRDELAFSTWTGSVVLRVNSNGVTLAVDPGGPGRLPAETERASSGLLVAGYARGSGRIYAFGGTPTGTTAMTNAVRSYDTTGGDAWTGSPGRSADPLAPSPRQQATLLFTGSKLVVLGGADEGEVPTPGGGIYDLASQKWSSLPPGFEGLPPSSASAVWTGSEVVAVYRPSEMPPLGFRFSPRGSTVTPLTGMNVNPPTGARFSLAVWTGSSWLMPGVNGSTPGMWSFGVQ